MPESHDRAVAFGDQRDLDGARSWRNRVALAFPAPSEHHPAVGYDLEILAAHDIAPVEVDSIDSARLWIEGDVQTFPPHHLGRVGEEKKDRLRACRDENLSLHRVSFAGCHVHRASVLQLRPPASVVVIGHPRMIPETGA